MIVAVDLSAEPHTVELREPEDCRRFHVEVRETGDVEGALQDAGAGRVCATGAAIEVEWLRAQAEGRVAEGWEDDFATMLDFARERGWLSDDAGTVEAHIEWE